MKNRIYLFVSFSKKNLKSRKHNKNIVFILQRVMKNTSIENGNKEKHPLFLHHLISSRNFENKNELKNKMIIL